MNKLTALEKIRNYSVYIEFCTDGSGRLFEFWDEEQIFEFDSIEDLEVFLNEET